MMVRLCSKTPLAGSSEWLLKEVDSRLVSRQRVFGKENGEAVEGVS